MALLNQGWAHGLTLTYKRIITEINYERIQLQNY